jgi:hypothetical protein
MPVYEVVFKGKNSRQYMTLTAKDSDEAKRLAKQQQARRHMRFPLTFARLDQALETGEMGLLAASVRKPSPDELKAWHSRQTELRKRDQARYDDDELKLESCRKVGG